MSTVRRVITASVASAAMTPAASAIDQEAGQFPTWIAAPGRAVMTRATVVTNDVPRPVTCSNTQPKAGFNVLRSAPTAPVTIITGRSGNTTAFAIGPAMEMTPNVPAITGNVASCAASVTANGSAIKRGPG